MERVKCFANEQIPQINHSVTIWNFMKTVVYYLNRTISVANT